MNEILTKKTAKRFLVNNPKCVFIVFDVLFYFDFFYKKSAVG